MLTFAPVKRYLKFAGSRFAGWLRSIPNRTFSFSSIIRSLFVGGCFLTITVAPVLRVSQPTGDKRSYWIFLISKSWYLLVAAVALKLEERLKKRKSFDKIKRVNWETRKPKAAQAIAQ